MPAETHVEQGPMGRQMAARVSALRRPSSRVARFQRERDARDPGERARVGVVSDLSARRAAR